MSQISQIKKIYHAAIYVRLSKEDGAVASHEKAESNSIANQKSLIREFLKSKNDIVIEQEYVDDGFSGSNFSRPNFVKMMDLVKAGKIQVIVTKDYSRLGRDYLEVGNYMECIFPVLQVRYISVNDNYDSANSFGSTGGMSVALKNLVNALYCKDASKKVRAAKAVLAKQGKYIAAFAPFGYQKSEDDKHMLVPDPITAPVVQLIFELAIKGMKYTEIANYLNNNGYDSIFEYYQKIGVKRCYDRDIGEHMWSASTVMEILYNEVYIGSVINNKTADNIDTGHQVVQRDKEDWIIVENCHEPLVSVEDFKLAHKMIARREVTKRKPNGKWRKSYIRCGICGKGLCKYGNKSSYRCHNGHVSRIRGKELEAALLDIARNMALSQLQEFELKTNGGNCPDNLEREIESLKKSKAHYAKLKFEIYDDYTKANITRDQMAKKTAEVKQKIAEIESLITEKQETLDMQKDLFLDAKQEQLTKLSKLDEFDEEVIRYLIDYVLVYDNEHIEIRWNFDDFQAG
ncbi:MAG: recombinase family protein [Eubacterium sp.]|nr:recombinase family protein [Eubacterium sp.]